MRGPGISVTVVDTKQNLPVLSHVFFDLPLRIGRDSRNRGITLDYPFISSLHLTLDVVSKNVVARDEGSKNGVMLGGDVGKMVPRTLYNLAQYGNTFALGDLTVTVSAVNTESTAHEQNDRPRAGSMLARRLGHTPEVAERRLAPPSIQTVDDAVASTQALHDAVASASAQYRAALYHAFEKLPAEDRVRYLRALADRQPESLDNAEFRGRAAQFGLTVAELRPPELTRVEDGALLVLQQLAASYCVPTTITTLPAVITFGRKLQDLADAVFSAVIPLRDGLKQFGMEIGVAHAGSQSELMRQLDYARTQEEVSSALLGNPFDGGETFQALHNLFAKHMVHSIGMTHACMEGVRSLLRELSPETMHQSVTTTSASLMSRAFPFRALWEAYERRHDDFASEDHETFRRVFGPEFAAAYNAVFADGAAQEVERGKARQRRPVLAGKSRIAALQQAQAARPSAPAAGPNDALRPAMPPRGRER